MPVTKKPYISGMNDYRPVALTLVLTQSTKQCFELLVRSHITAVLTASLHPHQFAYEVTKSTEDAIARALYSMLSHLEGQRSYVRMLFLAYSSTFNIVLPHKLVVKLRDFGLPHSIWKWINNQTVRVGNHISSTLSHCTGSP